MPAGEQPEEQTPDKDDPEPAQRAEDDAERLRGGPEEKAVDKAREQLSRLRERE